jgi:hypothetical protein
MLSLAPDSEGKVEAGFLPQDFLASAREPGGGRARIPFSGVGEEGSEHCALVAGESAGIHAIVSVSRGFDAVNAVPHFDDIGVEFENALFGKEQLHPDCVIGFEPLSHPGTALPEEQGSRALHRDGGSASRIISRAFAALARHLNFAPVEPMMLEKSLVFSDAHELQEITGHLADIPPLIQTLRGMLAGQPGFRLAQEHQRRHRGIHPADARDFENWRYQSQGEKAKN